MVNNRRKLTQRAGAYADFTQVKTCNLEPSVEQYKVPCTTLTDNQFGFKDIVGYYSGGKRSRNQSRKQSRRGSIKNERRYDNQKGGKTKSELEEELRKLQNWWDELNMYDPPMHTGPSDLYKSSKKSLLQQIVDAARKEEQGIEEATKALAKYEAIEASAAADAARYELEKQERLEAARANPLSWRNNPKYAGGCGSAITDCMGNTISNMGDMTHLSTASEQAWSNRNIYGAPSSTNEVPQKGGKNNKYNKRSRKQQF